MRTSVNNAVYAELGARWYDADDDPIALLRAETALRNPWIAQTIERELGPGPRRVLDLGCGAGFLANEMAARGHVVTGIDSAVESLTIAAQHDRTGTVTYRPGDATGLDFPARSFDVVCAMDLLEHVEEPARLVAEAARVLVPGGLFFFYTFNRTLRAWLLAVKGVEWFVANTPRHLHLLRLFIKPRELEAMCRERGLSVEELRGARPRIDRAFLALLRTGRVPASFRFVFTPSLATGYLGWARARQVS